ncbi:MAG: NMD3-related protein [Candidatus Nanoarchaeia archaeon]|nr:NMD3-related protein [Candidatus Nanoarchaeia archaeon]
MVKDLTGGYFESIIQLRPYDKEVYDFIMDAIEHRKGVSLAKKVTKNYGIDLYISSNRFALALSKQLKKKFDGEMKISRALYGTSHLTSKLLYRVTILFRVKKESL